MGKHILLADDDDDDRMLFQEALREVSQDTQLTMAIDGEQLMEVLDALLPARPTVLFLDLNMPRKNGFACLEELRQREVFKDMPIVVMSTSDDAATIDMLHRSGASHYISKPPSFEVLKSAVEYFYRMDWTSAHPSSREAFVLTF
jgi:CheY-like chemotaxis protein